METPSTKEALNSLNQLGISNTFTFVYAAGDENLIKSLRNIEKARIVSANKLAAIDVISTDFTVFSIASAEQFAGDKE